MNALSASLTITAVGMGGIFVFMLIFYISIKLLNKFFPGEEVHHNAKQEAA